MWAQNRITECQGPGKSFSISLSFYKGEDQDPERCLVKNKHLIDESINLGPEGKK